MFMDGRKLSGQTLEADICLIGGGVAGIAIAREFIGSNQSVIMLESGGTDGNPDTQRLYEGETTGRKYELMESRLRMFGGSSNHWEGLCAPLDNIDFKKRTWVPYSGWPISKDVLLPYYTRAAAFLNLSNKSADDFSSSSNLLPANDKFNVRMWRMAGALKLGDEYDEELAAAKNIRVLLNSNVTKIRSDNHTHADSLDVQTLVEQKFSVKAKRYVLCCGGIENARLLLLSDGLGNDHGNVGRFFMEHPRIKIGTLYTFNSAEAIEPFEQYIGMPDTPEKIYTITPSESTAASEKILSCSLVVRYIEKLKEPPSVLEYMGRMMGAGAKQYYKMMLFGRTGHAPNPDNRVTLSDKKDSLGQPRTRLHVTIGDMEWKTMRSISTQLANFLPAHKLGLVHLDKWICEEGNWPNYTLWSWHHMGTTRMSNSPQNGVVDKDCKLHSVDNVYVAGSSVFRTSGWANPTYTLTALALRLADHLKNNAA